MDTPKRLDGAEWHQWHDYSAPRRVYMFELDAAPGAPAFGIIKTDEEGRSVSEPSAAGIEVLKALQDIRGEYRDMKFINVTLLPGKLLMVVCATGDSGCHLPEMIMGVKRESARRLSGMMTGETVFSTGLRHRILRPHDETHLRRMLSYVEQAPRREIEEIDSSGLFRRRRIKDTKGEIWTVYGNISLLEEPEIVAVKISRSYSPTQVCTLENSWKKTMENCGVLVSPFISAAERRVRDRTVEAGGRMIVILHEGIGPDFNMTGKMRAMCADGRLLVIGANEYPPEKPYASRADCMRMNEIASSISSGLFGIGKVAEISKY